MKNIVWYLVTSDESNKSGLIFPSEMSYGGYKIGQWFIVANEGVLQESYDFDIVQNMEPYTGKMKRINNNFYKVRAKDGKEYFFMIEKVRYYNGKYVGRSSFINSEDTLCLVLPTNLDALSSAANERKHFFVGRVDIERRALIL